MMLCPIISRIDVFCFFVSLFILFHIDQPGGYKNRGDLDTEIGIRRACRFSKTLLGPCSGTEDQDFGFSEGKPCLIVKLNRIVYFRPEVGLLDFHVAFIFIEKNVTLNQTIEILKITNYLYYIVQYS